MALPTVNEALARLADAGIDFFAVEDLQTELGLRPEQARKLAHRLHRQNLARRIKRNLYALTDPAAWAHPKTLGTNWYRTAAALAGDNPYYLAYYTAMELHRMTQHPLRTVLVAVTRQKQPVVTGNVTFKFVTLKQDRFFGFEEIEAEQGHRVKVADLERTFIDCVDRQDLCGGLEEVTRGIARRADDLKPDRLVRYLHKLGRPFAAKRLGFLLELVGHGDPELLWELEALGAKVKRYVPLNTGGPKTGTRNRRWQLEVDTEIAQLLKAIRT